jgi:hypothetical protein
MPELPDYEKLGVFYLGKIFDLDRRQPRDELLLYKSKDLTTHAVCVGMTGSGKTGLCLTLLEEAAIDGIPAIAIDPKGDLGNLLLTFPQLRSLDFEPWLDPGEVEASGVGPAEFSARTAKKWSDALAAWGQDGARIARLKSNCEMAVYTPGSSAGLALSVVRSLAVPSASVLSDADALRQRISSAVAGLLALMGIDAEGPSSREPTLLAAIFENAWRVGRDLDMAGLIREIQSPAINKVGLVDLETFYPAKQRFELTMTLNNLVASPSVAGWMEGEPLDVGRLLTTPAGRPRLSIVSIAHLADRERMFFVTVLLNEVLSWMRAQPGTSALRAILYMDEVFGYFPPTANPPTKRPMLTLLKQARAYGLGVVLATQNPVDLDYKGLSNAGTWFLGRLQTERDKARVLEGLAGASAASGKSFDEERLSHTLSALGNRVFLLNNVHDDEPVVFQTRWTLSYLRGPLTQAQIGSLMADRKSPAPPVADDAPPAARPPGSASHASGERPLLPPGVEECFLPIGGSATGGQVVYHPSLLGVAKLHFVDARLEVDQWEDVALLAPLSQGNKLPNWPDARRLEQTAEATQSEPRPGACFTPFPAGLVGGKAIASWATAFKDHLYRNHVLLLWKCDELKLVSKPGESEGEFRSRLAHAARERRDSAVGKLEARYASKLAAVKEQVRKAEARLATEKAQSAQQSISAAVSFGTSMLGALLGRKAASAANIQRAGSTIRAATRAAKEHGDIPAAEATLESRRQKLAELDAEFNAEVDQLQTPCPPEAFELKAVRVRPRKTEIAVERVVLAWTPE